MIGFGGAGFLVMRQVSAGRYVRSIGQLSGLQKAAPVKERGGLPSMAGGAEGSDETVEGCDFNCSGRRCSRAFHFWHLQNEARADPAHLFRCPQINGKILNIFSRVRDAGAVAGGGIGGYWLTLLLYTLASMARSYSRWLHE